MTSTAPEQRMLVEGGSYTVTPRVRSTARRLAFWVGALIFILLVGLITLFVQGSGAGGAELSGTNAADNGSKALIEVLRQNGVTVNTPRTLPHVIKDTGHGDSTTLVVYDLKSILGHDQLTQLGQLTHNLVLIQPSFDQLSALAPEIEHAGDANSNLRADCSFQPVRQAGTVVATDAVGYRFDAGVSRGISCLGSGGDVHSLLRYRRGAETVTVVGTANAFTNQTITSGGNAALALGLFGQTSRLVWYLPSATDLRSAGPASVPYPGWLGPTVLLGVLLIFAAAFWRGRRFGPLVIENLPVVVRASETMEGRARLYQKASSRTHALDALRIGTIGRIATLCGLPRLATIDEIVASVSVATGQPPTALRALLIDDIPRNDAQLLRLSDDLVTLEREVATATRPS